MVIQIFGMVADAFAGFFSLYSGLDFALGISSFACIAIAMWSITRFLVLPILGGHYSISDGETDILTETVTETVTDSTAHHAKPINHRDGSRDTHTTGRTKVTTSSRTSRRRVKR